MTWTSGYVSEIDYTHGYYRELSPALIDFSLLLGGYEAPNRRHMRYLELGYGQGFSVNIHAAATAGEYWGTDFNPTHAANAQSLARASGADAHLFDDGFIEFKQRGDLPLFDYIVVHGVWSWISAENRKAIVDILRDHLNVGGVVYLSYNALPGWASAMPLRHIMATHIEAAGNLAQGLTSRIDAAIAFGQNLIETEALYFTANPVAKSRLEAIAGQDRHYLAHEYFNRDWQPMYFSEVGESLTEAKLTYATSASPVEQLDGYNLSVEQQKLLNAINYDVLRETVRDYILNRPFRKDLYTKGARRLTPLEHSERWNDTRIILTVPPETIPLEVDTPRGKIGLKEDFYRAVIAALDAESTPQRLGDLANRPELATLPPGALSEIIAVLVGTGRASPVQSDEAIEAARPRCRRLNAHLISRARLSNDTTFLASPVIGSGIPVARFEQMFLDARSRGKTAPEDLAKDAWEVLAKQNQAIIKNGVMLKTADENLDELTAQARRLCDRGLRLYRQLGVLDA